MRKEDGSIRVYEVRVTWIYIQGLEASRSNYAASNPPRILTTHAPTQTAMTSTIGIPIKLLNEATGHVVTLEVTSGQVYRGKLLEGEFDMQRERLRQKLTTFSS